MTAEGKVSLLIAEDDPHIRYILEAAAERTGCFAPIVTAADGEAAWRVIQRLEPREYPELIVSDYCMPKMDGVELIRALKSDERTRAIPVAIITSSEEVGVREMALGAGACGFERKPHGLEALMRLLTDLRHQHCGVPAGH